MYKSTWRRHKIKCCARSWWNSVGRFMNSKVCLCPKIDMEINEIRFCWKMTYNRTWNFFFDEKYQILTVMQVFLNHSHSCVVWNVNKKSESIVDWILIWNVDIGIVTINFQNQKDFMNHNISLKKLAYQIWTRMFTSKLLIFACLEVSVIWFCTGYRSEITFFFFRHLLVVFENSLKMKGLISDSFCRNFELILYFSCLGQRVKQKWSQDFVTEMEDWMLD